MNRCILIFNTIKYLRFTQIYYRLFYFARVRLRKFIAYGYKFSKDSKSTSLKLIDSCESYSTYKDGEFLFLNLSKKFDFKIDWNYSELGKLWTYNLSYFEYLKEKNDVSLIYDFISNIKSIKDGLEPFPISLRGINWIKFLTRHEIQDKKINDSLCAQYYILLDNIEYHLLGNHLLENGFSLLFGAYYFQDETLYKKARKILLEQLDEQVLDDGAHFELSPMYHQIMLFRVLDCINLVQNNNWKNQELLGCLKKKASVMLGWLKTIVYENGDIPLFNDSANKIAPSSSELFDYSVRLNLVAKTKNLNQSGYIKIKKKNYECMVDIGDVGASYIPGHAHADTFSFELHVKGVPFVVDTGVSTYETGDARDSQRSTKAHNTVEVNGKNSSEVWGGFRVGDRARVIDVVKDIDHIKATHDGYRKKFGVLHTRSWDFGEEKIIIEESLNKKCDATARLHFHPDVTEDAINKRISTNHKSQITTYNYAPEFNKILRALVLEVAFDKELKIEIKI